MNGSTQLNGNHPTVRISTNPFENPAPVNRGVRRQDGLGPHEGWPADVFADPAKSSRKERSRDRRRPRRRNSESSIMDKPKLLDGSDDDRQRRERRHRERDGRSRDGKHRSSRKQQRQLDIIDKLDVTSIYGTGSKWSH